MIDRDQRRAVTPPRPIQSRAQSTLEDPEALLWCRRGTERLAQLAGPPSPHGVQVEVRVRETAGRDAEERRGPARSEVHPHDRRVLERVDDEEAAVRAGDDRAGQAPAALLVGVVDPELVLVEVDDELERSARQDALPSVAGSVAQAPEVLDEAIERRPRDGRPVEHRQTESAISGGSGTDRHGATGPPS